MEAMQIGPFYVNWSLLVFLVASGAGYGVVWLVYRRTQWHHLGIADQLFNALALGLLSWKLAPFLFHPTLLWRAPVRPLHDAIGIWMLVFIAIRAILGGWTYGKPTDLPWAISLSDPAFRYHPTNVYALLAALLIIVILAVRQIKPGDGQAGQLVFLVGGASYFAISLVAVEEVVGGLFTGMQWTGLVLIGLGLISRTMHILWEGYQERRGHVMSGNEDSKSAQRQEQVNKQATRQASPEQQGYDKKLDGPNKPST